MKDKKINKPVILIAPMDWGLGHATRCIPIITNLLNLGCDVILAASGAGRVLLKNQFPALTCLETRGYNIRYSRKRSLLPWVLLAQLPGIISTIYRERRWLKQIVEQYAVSAVISDNRPGFFHRNLPSVYITHQLQVKAGSRFVEWAIRKAHYRFINRFNECWVPDYAGELNLAGKLSHPVVLPAVPVKYIGPQSRFSKQELEKKYAAAVILSGPEPQRTMLENLVLKEASLCNGKIVLLRGVINAPVLNSKDNPSLEVYDLMNSDELNRLILQSEIIISRCGYSTVMDLIRLDKKAVLVPTPGQTEQEYLAGYLSVKKIFCCINQAQFSLTGALKEASGFAYRLAEIPVQHNDSIKSWVEKFRPHQ